MTKWTIAGQEITEEGIRSYSLRSEQDALSYDKLKIIAMDYLNKVLRKTPKFDKWPKEIKDICASKGIIQDKETGLPTSCTGTEQAWNCRAEHAEEVLMTADYHVNRLITAQKNVLDYVERLHTNDISTSDNQGAAIILEKIKFNIESEFEVINAS